MNYFAPPHFRRCNLLHDGVCHRGSEGQALKDVAAEKHSPVVFCSQKTETRVSLSAHYKRPVQCGACGRTSFNTDFSEGF